jgi:hypothetical protein
MLTRTRRQVPLAARRKGTDMTPKQADLMKRSKRRYHQELRKVVEAIAHAHGRAISTDADALAAQRALENVYVSIHRGADSYQLGG